MRRAADPDGERWNLLTFRAVVCAILFFQFVYQLQAKSGGEGRLALDLHLLLVGLPSLAFALTWYAGFQRYWRLVAMATSVAVIGEMAALSVVNEEIIPLFVVSILTLAGTCLLRWNEYWQAALSCYVLTAFAIVEVLVPSGARNQSLCWLGVLTGVGFAQIAVRLSSSYRRSLQLHLEVLKSAQAQSIQSEATIRQILDAIPGLVILTRFRDGRLLEVNQEFLERTGLSREQVLSGSTRELGLYARPEDRAALTRKLKTDRGVRDVELDFRLKEALVPYLVSAVVIDFQGEPCTVSIGQDIVKIRDSEHALREAQERLNVQIEELTVTQERLRAEVAERKAAERIALERETTLRKIFQASPDHIAIRRLSDGRYLEINKKFSLTGYSREELLGKRPDDLNIFISAAQSAELDERFRLEGQVRDAEVRLQHRDGRILDGLVSGTVVELSGEPCAISISRDISESKQTERALRAARELLSTQVEELTATQARLRDEIAEREAAERVAHERETTLSKLFEATPDIITVSSRRDFRLLQANSTFFHETGYSPDEVLGQPIYLKFWANPAEREQLKQTLDRDGVAHNMEADLVMKEGTVNSYLLSTVALELRGEPCRVSFWRNVTEAKRAARRVVDSEAILRRTFDAIPDIVITRRGDVVSDVNEEFVKRAGVSRAQVLGRRVEEATLFLRSEDRAEFLRRVRADGIVRNFQADLKIKGSAVPYLVSGAMIETEDGPLLFSISRDISSRIQMEQELIAAREAALAASQAKSEFLSSMSHEIRTPMNAILGMGELLAETGLDNDQRRFLDVINANSVALLELINSILDLAKVESGRLQIEETEFDLADVVDKTVATFQVRAHSKGLELATRIVPGTPEYLVGDPLRLRQILVNLIGNALKFTEVGEVVLLIENDPEAQESARLRFTVSDTGIGLPPDKLDSIFSSFTQADASTSRKYGGTGLGLAISQRLTMLMGGRICVESELGKGSKFIFTLPFGLASQIDTPTRFALPDLNGIRVLVVDDNATNRLIAREALTSRGAAVNEAASGEEALEALRSATECGQQHQLILLDMRMPMMDGLEVAKRIRHELRAFEPLIMMLSSDDLKPELSRLRESGLNAYLVKPITRKELFEAISRVLGEAKSTSAAPPAEPTTTSEEEPVDLSSISILVAEDLAVNRMLVSLFLAPLRCKLDFAENGREAVEMIMRNRYNMVLMDIQMPVMDGYEATRGIRDWERAHNAPRTNIVALTASALIEDAVKAREAGCDAHITKPVKKAALLQIIRGYSSIPSLLKQETGRAA